MLEEIQWYTRRLARMPAEEVAFRLYEEGKRRLDARRAFGWRDFAWAGAVRPLPGLAAPGPEWRYLLQDEAAAILSGRFNWLGVTWPRPARDPWWDGNIWLLDPVSGRPWPGGDAPASKAAYRRQPGYGDVKLVWELNRLQVLQPLAAAARFDDGRALVGAVEGILASWAKCNPPFRGVNWTNGIEIASRIVSLLMAAAWLGERLSPGALAQLRAMTAAHAWRLERYPSLFSSANNHRVAELAALFLAGLCCPDMPGADRYARIGREGLEREADRQFHPDGVGAEQSPTYAAYSLEWFALSAAAAASAGAPMSEAYSDRLRAAAGALRWMMDGGGRTPAIGDDDEGRVLALRQEPETRYAASVTALVGRLLDDPALSPPATDLALRDLLVPAPAAAGVGLEGSRTFDSGGYTVWRRPTAQGGLLAVFDHAPLGFLSIAAHGHADALSLWLHWGDEAILVDAGTYLYHAGGRWRDRFRGTAAHNTLCIEDRDQSRIAGPFNWSVHAKARLVASGEDWAMAEHDGYLAEFGVLHRRRVMVSAGKLTVTDVLEGRARRPANWTVGWTVTPDAEVRGSDGAFLIETRGGRRLTLSMPGATLGEGIYAKAFGHRSAAPRIMASGPLAEGAVCRTELAFI